MSENITFTQRTNTAGSSNPESINNRSFNDLTKSKKIIDSDSLFKIHEKVFYNIPKEGKKSHTSLIVDSRAYINNYIDPKDSLIEKLTREVDTLTDELSNKEQVELDGNPFFPDETFLKTSVVNSSGLPIWIMVNGVRREFKNYDTFVKAKTALGFNESEPDINILQEASEEILENIPSGPDINNDIDLVNINEDIESAIEDINLNDFVNTKSFAVKCYEKFSYDNAGICEIKYKNEKFEDTIVTLNVGEVLTDDLDNEFRVGPRINVQADPESTLKYGVVEVKGYTKFFLGNETIEYDIPTISEITPPPKYSKYNTRMFTKPPVEGDNYTYDDRGEEGVWEILNDPDHFYYDDDSGTEYQYEHQLILATEFRTHGTGRDVYGAPILRYDNAYIVELDSPDELFDDVYYLYLTSGNDGSKGEVGKLRRSKWEDKFGTSGDSKGSRPGYGSPGYRLKYDPGRVNEQFNKTGYTFNRNGKSRVNI